MLSSLLLLAAMGNPAAGAVPPAAMAVVPVTVTHGPVIGGVTHESARAVVRTSGACGVRLEFATAIDFSGSIASTSATADDAHDFFATVSVAGLAPATTYYYRVLLDDVIQPAVGTFRTFPVPGTGTTFTFAFGSCQQATGDTTSFDGRIWPWVAQAQPEFFIQAGDWGYPDFAWESTHLYPPFFHQVPGRLEQSYEAKYDPAYPMSQIFGTTPIDYVFDDHDYTHNNSDGSYPDKLNSVNAWRDYFPGYPGVRPDSAIYHSFRYDNCEFFVLDNRTQRDPNISAFPNILQWVQNPTTHLYFAPSAEHTVLGPQQLDWLIAGLTASTATWKFIVSTTPWNPGHRAAIELALALQGNPLYTPIHTPEGDYTPAQVALEFSDGGSAFPADWSRLIGAIADNHVQNVIVLSGDSHTACIDNGANSLVPEWTPAARSSARTPCCRASCPPRSA
jgi:alkaline phosphatase D